MWQQWATTTFTEHTLEATRLPVRDVPLSRGRQCQGGAGDDIGATGTLWDWPKAAQNLRDALPGSLPSKLPVTPSRTRAAAVTAQTQLKESPLSSGPAAPTHWPCGFGQTPVRKKTHGTEGCREGAVRAVCSAGPVPARGVPGNAGCVPVTTTCSAACTSL